MEYLMTYGWAILIIAVVLGAIYSLGLFNGASLAPRSQPGACQVIRPNGALTTQYVSLAGSCTNELPQYVGQFNGQTSVINFGNVPSLGTNSYTWAFWFNPQAWTPGPNYGMFGQANTGGSPYMLEQIVGGVQKLQFTANGGGAPVVYTPITTTQWQFITGTYNYSTGVMTIYSNGQSIQTATSVLSRVSRTIYAADGVDWGWPAFQGMISNIQMYNNSLDANSVKALYQEGIGGAPINLQTLVAWWPLNGNAYDYSGDAINGQPTAVTYTNQWLSGYTIP